MSRKIKSEETEYLFEAILSLKTVDECYDFFGDLCTINEILAMAQRMEVAKLLRNGETQLGIIKKTGASSATISRVNRSLNYGNEGYGLAFSRMTEKT